VTHVTHSDLLTHLTRDPLTLCHLRVQGCVVHPPSNDVVSVLERQSRGILVPRVRPEYKLTHTATPDVTKLSRLCRVRFDGVNWIPATTRDWRLMVVYSRAVQC